MSDTPTYLAPDSYVRKIGERNDGSPIYQAGENSNKYNAGQIVPNSYAKSVLGSVNYRNRVFGLIERGESERTKLRRRNRDPDQVENPTDYQEAQKVVSEFNDLTDRLNRAQKQEDEERIEEIEREIDKLRKKYGS